MEINQKPENYHTKNPWWIVASIGLPYLSLTILRKVVLHVVLSVPATVVDLGDLAAAAGDDSAFIDYGHFGAIGFDAVAMPEPDIGIFLNTNILLGSIAPAGVTICMCVYVSGAFGLRALRRDGA
jgi:hypothetical protein